MRVLTNLLFLFTFPAASSRKFSAGPVVSGFDSAASIRFRFFCALSNFQLNHLSLLFGHQRIIDFTATSIKQGTTIAKDTE